MKFDPVQIGDVTYLLRESIAAADGLEWIKRYMVEPSGDVSIQAAAGASLKRIANSYDDFAFLVERICVDERGKPLSSGDVPLPHVPKLARHMRERLRIGEFIAAMTRELTEDDEHEDGGSEKNLQSG